MRGRTITVGLMLVASTVALSAPAQAATLIVDDDAVECPSAGFTSIQAAVTAASDGDTITVCPGTYVETIDLGDKSLTIDGMDRDTTIVDGNDATGVAAGGTIASSKHTPGTTTIRDLTVMNFGDRGGFKVGILLRGLTAGVAFLVDNVRFVGSNSLAVNPEFGFYSIENQGEITVQNSLFEGIRSNNLLFEYPKGSYTPGPVHVLNNTFASGLDGSSALFSMTYENKDVTTQQEVSGNTIDATNGGGIVFNSAPSFVAPERRFGRYMDIDITDNVISNLKAGSAGAIVLRNQATVGTDGEISGAVISGNTVIGTGAADSRGVRLQGLVTGTQVTGNTFISLSPALIGEAFGTHMPATTVATANSISGGGLGVVWGGSDMLDATENWWGAADGPSDWGTGSGDSVSAGVDFFPWYTNAGMTILRTCDRTAVPGVLLRGSGASEVLCGSAGADRISGRGGADLVLGNGGADKLDGDAGPDAVIGGPGNDLVRGNAGFDSLQGWTGTDTCQLGADGGQRASCP